MTCIAEHCLKRSCHHSYAFFATELSLIQSNARSVKNCTVEDVCLITKRSRESLIATINVGLRIVWLISPNKKKQFITTWNLNVHMTDVKNHFHLGPTTNIWKKIVKLKHTTKSSFLKVNATKKLMNKNQNYKNMQKDLVDITFSQLILLSYSLKKES